MSFSHIELCLVTFPLPLLRLLQNCYCYFCHHYRYFHTTLLLNTLLQILSLSGVVELTTQQLILENILWLPLCRINKFGLNTLPSKAVAIPYTCGLSGLLKDLEKKVGLSRKEWIAGAGVASLLKTEGESSAELDGSSLPPLVVEGKKSWF